MAKLFTNLLKFGFTTLCCTIAAGAAAASPPLVRVIVCVLLVALLVVTLRIGGQGKPSESWLTLACGSWITAQFSLFLMVLLNIRTGWQYSWAGGMLAGMLAVIVFFGYRGIKAALRGAWTEVLAWWFGSFLFLIPYCICALMSTDG